MKMSDPLKAIVFGVAIVLIGGVLLSTSLFPTGWAFIATGASIVLIGPIAVDMWNDR